MEQFHPSALPCIDDVDIVDLRWLNPDNVGAYMSLARESHVFAWRVPREVAQQIAELFRRLPDAEQARCHLPRYGVRFFAHRALVLEASLCWECNNAFGATLDSEVAFSFDANARPSRALLALVKKSMPEVPMSRSPRT